MTSTIDGGVHLMAVCVFDGGVCVGWRCASDGGVRLMAVCVQFDGGVHCGQTGGAICTHPHGHAGMLGEH